MIWRRRGSNPGTLADGPGAGADGEDLEAGEVEADPGQEAELRLDPDNLLGQRDDAGLNGGHRGGQGRLEHNSVMKTWHLSISFMRRCIISRLGYLVEPKI